MLHKSGFWFLLAMLFLLFDAFDGVLQPNGATVAAVLFMIVGLGVLPRETRQRPAQERAGETGRQSNGGAATAPGGGATAAAPVRQVR